MVLAWKPTINIWKREKVNKNQCLQFSSHFWKANKSISVTCQPQGNPVVLHWSHAEKSPVTWKHQDLEQWQQQPTKAMNPISQWTQLTGWLLKHHYPPVNKHSNGKSPSWIGNTSSNGGFSIAMLDYRSVIFVWRGAWKLPETNMFIEAGSRVTTIPSMGRLSIFTYYMKTHTNQAFMKVNVQSSHWSYGVDKVANVVIYI